MRRRLSVIGLLVCLVSSGAWAIEWATYAGNWSDPNGWTISGVAAGRIPAGTDDVQIQGPNSVCTLNTSTVGWGQARLRVNTSGTLCVVDGGQLLGSSWLRASSNATPGTMIQTGGLVKITDGSDKAKLGIGDSAGSDGLYIISGGTLTTDSTTGALNIGARGGKGRFVVVGSKATILMNTLAVPESSGTPSGTLEFQVDSTGVSPIGVKTSVTLDPLGANSTSALVVSAIAPPPIRDIVLVDLQSTKAVSGVFDTVNGNPAVEGATVVLSAGGRTCTYTLTYVGGTGNDIVLVYQSSKTIPTSVIGDFEDGMTGWDNTWEGKSVLSIGTIGATSGTHSLVITPVKNAFSWALRYNCPAPIDFTTFKTVSVDVTWVASEWAGSGIWVQFNLMAVNSDGKSSWQQSGPSDPINPAYPGSWDPVNWGNQTRTLTWDISQYDATGATWMQLVFSTNMGNVTTVGNYYIDNVKLIGPEAAGSVSVDSFGTAHDYLTGGLGTYDGIVDVNQIDALNADANRPGALYLQTTGASWDPGPGPMLYKLVKGDFVATVKVVDFAGTAAAPVFHNDSGILVRDPASAAGTENWVSVNYFPTWTAFVARNTIAGVRAELGQPAGSWTGTDTFALAAQYPYIQLERKGSDFFFRISSDGVNFIPLTKETYAGVYTGTQTPLVVSRPDLPATLQIGLVNATYDVTTGYVAFDDFKITTP